MVAVAAISVLAGGCGSGTAKQDCFAVWNARDNAPRRAQVAGRFAIADVSEWTASPSGGDESSHGCGYLFHDRRHYLSFSWERTPLRRWGVPPTQRGPWSPEQQASVRDNARVESDGSVQQR